MYSPKIDERLIPTLYHLARARRVPMTVLVTEAVAEYLSRQDLSQVPALPTPAAGAADGRYAAPAGRAAQPAA
jgi:predicted transcriptional regulator